MSFNITKEFKFEYAHALNLDYDSPCKDVHGHSAVVKVTLYATKLNKNGMVVDFKDLSFIQKYLDESFDHRLVLQKKDLNHHVVTKNLSITVTFVNGNPTAENLAKLIGTYISKHILEICQDIYCIDVEFFETAKNSATYTTMRGESDGDDECDKCGKVGSEKATGCDGNCGDKKSCDECDQKHNDDDDDPCEECDEENCDGCRFNDPDCEGCTEDDCEGCDFKCDDCTDKCGEQDEDNIFIEITAKGIKYLKLEKESSSLYSFLEFIDNAAVTIPANQDINDMISEINYQYYDYENSSEKSFTKDTFLNCLTKGYVQFSLV